MVDNNSIGAIIVTYNRLEKLKRALACFSKQTKTPEYIIVVDNASSDGTEEYLKKWAKTIEPFEKIILRQTENLGGSGGFYAGLERAINLQSNWIWVSDDDAYPEKDAIELLYNYISSHNSGEISAVCTSVINHNEYDITHRVRYFVKGHRVTVEYVLPEEYANGPFELNAFSYVGTLINKDKLNEVGLTNKDFFIWCDDAEHSLRLNKVGKIICVPSARVDHDQEIQKGSKLVTWKTYYGVRNNYVMYKNIFPKGCSRRYLLIRFLYLGKIIVRSIMKKENTIEYVKLYLTALRDGIKHNMGLHSVYKPGWKA